MIKHFPLLLFLLILGIGCSGDKNFEPEIIERTDKAYSAFLKAKSVEDIDKKLRLLSLAASHLEDPQDSLWMEIMDHQVYYYDLQKSYDSSLYFANRMIEKAKAWGDTTSLAKGFYRRGRVHLYKEEYLQVLEDMHQAQKYYLLGGDSINAGKRLVELGITQYRLGDFSGSQAQQIQALKLLKGSGGSIYLSRIYNSLAMNYRQLKDYDEAIDEYHTALKFVPSKEDSLSVLNNIANVYVEKEDYGPALRLFDSIIPQAKDKNTLHRLKDNYFFTLWLHNESKVEDSLKMIMQLRKKEKDLEGLLSSYNHLIQINSDKEPQEALRYAREQYELCLRLNSVTDQMAALKTLIELSPAGEEKQYTLIFLHINDSMVTARNQVKNAYAKIRFDEEQKLEEIKVLESLTNNQKLELLQERNRRNTAIFVIFLLFILAFFIYYLLKQRHKRKTIREIHQTEVRISKRIHDELANDVYNVITEVENPARFNKEAVLNKLDSIYSRTRNISRENTPVNTGPGFAEDL